MNAPRIIRLVKIVDTREREERDGAYSSYSVPVSGTGITNACDRCGAAHEVHAYVEVEGGEIVIVGTGCARKAALDAGDAALARAIATADRRAKVRAGVVAEIANLRRLVAERAAAETAIAALEVPAVEWVHNGTRWNVVCGDVEVWSLDGREPREGEKFYYARERVEERERCARGAWADKRHAERGTGTHDHRGAAMRIADAVKRLAKIDAVKA